MEDAKANIEWNINVAKVKRCNACKKLKPVRYFFKKGGGRISSNCKPCDIARLKKYKNTDEYRARHAFREREINKTPEGKLRLKIRNRRAYLKRQKKKIHKILFDMNQNKSN